MISWGWKYRLTPVLTIYGSDFGIQMMLFTGYSPVAHSDAVIAVVMLNNALLLICNIIVLRMAGQHEERMNDKLRRAIFGWLGRFICRKYKVYPETSSKTESRRNKPIASVSNDRAASCETSDNALSTTPALSNAGLNPDPHKLSRADRGLLLSASRLHHPLAEGRSPRGSSGVSDNDSFQEEWEKAARILDRFLGICCFLLMVFTLLGVYFVYS